MTTELDFAALTATQPALAAFVTEARMVVAHAGTGGTFVAWRPFDDEDVHICTMRDKPTRVLLQVVLERDANWKHRSLQVTRLLAEGGLVPTVDGAHLIVTEQQLLGTTPLRLPTPHPPPPIGLSIDLDALHQLCPPFAEWMPASNFVAAFNGPAGLFVVTRPTSDTYILVPRGESRQYVFYENENDEGWDHARAQQVARLLASGVLVATPKDGHFVLDDEALASHEITLDDLERWPSLDAFLRDDDDFVAAFHGPGGVFMACRASMVGELDWQRYLVMTLRGESREIVWLYLEPETTMWRDAETATAIASALAAGTIELTKTPDDLHWIVDEFEADKVE